MTESFDIGELLTLAKDNSPESRARLFGLMGDLFLNKGGYLSAEERTNLSGILSTLLPQADKDARLKLAQDLSGSTAVPRELARRIAEDEIEVASPVLVKSAKLTDQDLVELAAHSPQHAAVIATRRGLSMTVTDGLIRAGQTDVLQAILDNASSQISIAALHTALEKAKNSDDLQDSISRRVELPEEIAAELMEWANDRVRERLMDRFNILMVELIPPSEDEEELPPLDLNQFNRANGVIAEPEPDLADMPATGFARYGAASNATPTPIGMPKIKPAAVAAQGVSQAAPQGSAQPAAPTSDPAAEEEARLEEARFAEAEALRAKAKKDLVAKTLAALAHDNQPAPAAPPVAAAAPIDEPPIEEPAPVEAAPVEAAAPLKRDSAAERLTFDAVDMELELIDAGDGAEMPPLAVPMPRAELDAHAMDLELELEQGPPVEIAAVEVAELEPSAEAPLSVAESEPQVAAPQIETPEVEAPEIETPHLEAPEMAMAEVETAEPALPEIQPAEIAPAAAEAEAVATETLEVAESFALADSTAPEPVAEVAPEAPVAAMQEEPAAEEPAVEEPVVEQPAADEPVIEEPVAEEPAIAEPAVEELLAEAAHAETPVIEGPAIEASVAEEAVVEEAPVEAAAIEEPAVEKIYTEEIHAEEMVAEAEVAAEEPALEKIAEAPAAAVSEPEPEPEVIEEPVAIAASTDQTPVEDSSIEQAPIERAPEHHPEPVAAKLEPSAAEPPLPPISDPKKAALLDRFIKAELASTATQGFPDGSEEAPAADQPAAAAMAEEPPQIAAVEPPTPMPDPAAPEPMPEPVAASVPESEPEPEPEPVKPAAAARRRVPQGGEHKLTTTLVIAMLNNGGLAHAEAMFAQMTGLRIGLVRRLAAESGGEGLAMAARAIHMSREDFSTIYLLWRRLKARDGFVSTSDHGKALDFFDSAPQDRVMSVMTRWRKDPEKLFATG